MTYLAMNRGIMKKHAVVQKIAKELLLQETVITAERNCSFFMMIPMPVNVESECGMKILL